jgi:hypothetical protein
VLLVCDKASTTPVVCDFVIRNDAFYLLHICIILLEATVLILASLVDLGGGVMGVPRISLKFPWYIEWPLPELQYASHSIV